MTKFIYPKYQGESLLNIPATILSLFGARTHHQPLLKKYYQDIEGVEKIVLLVLDGLGWSLFEKEALQYPFFQKAVKKGLLNKITSIFPSSTAPALNTLHSGLSPLEHGLIEWYMYFPEIDCMVQSLPFEAILAEDQTRLNNPPKDILFHGQTVYQRLAEKGVSSFVFSHESYLNSFYSQAATRGSKKVGYCRLSDFLVALAGEINQVPRKAYFYAYWPEPDGLGHRFGPQNKEVVAEIAQLAYMLNEWLIKQIDNKVAEKVGIFITADHGQVAGDLKNTFYLDEISDLQKSFQVSKNGRIIPPAGISRDCFLHIKEEKLQEVKEILENKLKDKAKIITVTQGLELGLFGNGKVHPEFLRRTGNLLILPYDNHLLWYRYRPGYETKNIGQHGGLSKEEIEIPLISVRLSDLKD